MAIEQLKEEITVGTAAVKAIFNICDTKDVKDHQKVVDQFVQGMKPWRLSEPLQKYLGKVDKIICISDTHFGAGPEKTADGKVKWNARDKISSARTEEFKQFLEYCGKSANTAVFYLGDIVESWEADGSKVIKDRHDLFDKMARGKWLYMPGNHDRWFANGIECRDAISGHPFFDKITREFVMQIGTKRVLFMHGHEIDPYNCGEEPPVGQAMTILAAGVEDTLGTSKLKGDDETVDDHIETMAGRISTLAGSVLGWIPKVCSTIFSPKTTNNDDFTPSKNNSLFALHLAATAMLKDRCQNTDNAFDYVVMGHTHRVGNRKWYHNDGGWVTDTPTFIEISTNEGNAPVFRYYQWKDNNAVPIGDPTLKV